MVEATRTAIPAAGQGDLRGGPGDGEVDGIEADLAEVDAAMVRLDDGSYGTCAACGASLTDEILAVFPTARTCPDHR